MPVVPGSLPGGDLPGIRYVPGCDLAQALAVFRAKVNLVDPAIEAERPGLDILRVTAHITDEHHLPDSRHQPYPNRVSDNSIV